MDSIERQKMNIEENNPIKAPSQNTNNISGSKKYKNDEDNTKEIPKFNQFMFTPLQSLLLNKKMPHGFKFEIEENIHKILELSKPNQRRVKPKGFLQEPKIVVKPMKSIINDEKKNSAEKTHSTKPVKKIKKEEKEGPKNSNTNANNNSNNPINTSKIEGNNSEAYKIRIKCTSGFNKIKSSPGASLFYIGKTPDAPSLANIEKKINNFEYKTLDECFSDIRTLWNYQFRMHAKEPSVYQNICKLSTLTETVLKELKNEKNTTFNEKKEEISIIKKRTEKLKKDLDEFNGNSQKDLTKMNKTKNTASIHNLSQMIRNLTKIQLKGIIPILWENNEATDKKTYEFDLDKLSDDKFKKLEKYVVDCFNENKNINHINKALNHKKENKSNGINNSNKKNGNMNTSGIYKNNNNNHQNNIRKEESKKVNNSFSDSDSVSSNSSL
jgi:hypothetical protein